MAKRLRLQALIEISICAALAMLLDFLPSIKPIPSISISVAMVPIFIVAFRWGFIASVVSGFLWGLLQVALGDAWILTPVQAFMEYFVAFAFIGFAGLFSRLVQRSLKYRLKRSAILWIVVGIFVGSAARYFWHFLAGVVFFKALKIDTVLSPVLYSFIANGITFIFATLGCLVVIVLLVAKAPQLITSSNKNNNLNGNQ